MSAEETLAKVRAILEDSPTVRHGPFNKAAYQAWLGMLAGVLSAPDAKSVIGDVAAERRRQIEVEGWTPEHDDTAHVDGTLALAGAAYAYAGQDGRTPARQPPFWPWPSWFWNPKDRRRDLIRAAALIVAEIERLDRAEGR